MYDAHYDLLTILYFRMKQGNKYQDIDKLIGDLKQIYRPDNINGGIVNLFFMSKEEMKDELDISEDEYLDVPKMFEDSINNLEIMMEQGVIPKQTDFLYSIEGCDYIKDEKELEELYEMGLRSILPVWNEKNIYGSGIRDDSGLTEEGKLFLKKAIDLGIMIDVSHANQKTFFDIMDLIEEEQKDGKEVFVLASHSNVKNFCNNSRNLTDEQLLRLKGVGGYIGLLVHGGFLTKENEQITMNERKPYFVKHLNYLLKDLGFPEDRIMVATDNMNYHPDPEYHNLEAFKIENVNKELRGYLKIDYSDNFINKIMADNMKNLFKNVRDFEKKLSSTKSYK